MTTSNVAQPGASAAQAYETSGAYMGQREPANLGDILERVLDKGLVIAGDIQVNLLDIELLTIKLRLIIASIDTARQVGINWWEEDPWLSAGAARRAIERERDGSRGNGGRDLDGDLAAENRRLRARVRELESGPARASREDDRD